MDPFLVKRIGDVTIERVLPKQEQTKKDAVTIVKKSSDTQQSELNKFLNRTRSSRNLGEDEGGGSDDEFSEDEDSGGDDEMDDEEEEELEQSEDESLAPQEAPLSLVTNKTGDGSLNLSKVGISNEVKETISSPVESKKTNEEGRKDVVKEMKFEEEDELMKASENPEDERHSDEEFDDTDKDIQNKDWDPEEKQGDEHERMGRLPYDEDKGEETVKVKLEPDSGDEQEMIVIKQEPMQEEEEQDEEDDDDDDSKSKRKLNPNDEDSADKTAKKSKKDSGASSESESEADKSAIERKVTNMRRNIREVMDENQLDEATLAAQREEMERLRRVQEQQRLLREVNKQINANRQNSKTQTRVISLLQGNTSLLKSTPGSSTVPKSTAPNTVLVKLSSGSGAPQVVNKKVLELLRSTKSAVSSSTSASKTPNLAKSLLSKPHMMTPSVSIAPVKQGASPSPSEEDKNIAAAVRKVSGKPKGKDVVTISSSSSDEDDCILISEPSGGEESEQEEDPTNSGMHTNDLYNIPDEQGRVLINVGRPENEPDVFLAPQIARIIKPHQIGGVRFLFDNIVESLERYKTSTGFGCILAHSMGLGKTLQVVSFCDVFLRFTEGRTVLCIMPINTLQNWLAEFNMWLPSDPTTSHFNATGEVRPRTFPIFVLNDMQKSIMARAKVVAQWAKEGGVLLIGYELYRQLSMQKPRRARRSKKKLNINDDVDDEKNKPLLEEMHSALVKPGPDLVICDEGHRIKNSHASISQALKLIRSKRRIVLTGYPLQNNLLEYWCMVDFVRPNYLGTKTEFSNMFERPIQNGQCIDSTPQDIRLMRYRAHVLHSLLEGFVQRRSHSVLQHALPQKEEYVLLVRMTSFQRKLYDTFMNEVVRTKAVPNPLKAFAVCCKIWNHPDVLYHFLKKRAGGEAGVDLDLEEAGAAIAPATPVSSLTSPIPGMPVIPVKRGRGRSPKGTSPVKRERKVTPRKKGQVSEVQPLTKTPAVAAVIPNTISNSQSSTETSSTQMQSQPDCKPLTQDMDIKPQNISQFQPQQQFGSNFNQFPAGGNNFPPYQGGNQPPYQGFNPQQGQYPNQGSGFQNQTGFNNQNWNQGYNAQGYPPPPPYSDSNFGNQGNFWNNQMFNNDSNSQGMFSNFNDADGHNSSFFNQDGFNTDSFNNQNFNNPQTGSGFPMGMGMNRQAMPVNQPGPVGGNNNQNQGRMGIPPNQSGMNAPNSGGNIPQGGMGPNSQTQGLLGGMNSQTTGPMGMNPQNTRVSGTTQNPGMSMSSQNQNMMGMNSQNKTGMGMNNTGVGMSSQNAMGMIPQSTMSLNSQSSAGFGINSMNQQNLNFNSPNQMSGSMVTQNINPINQQGFNLASQSDGGMGGNNQVGGNMNTENGGQNLLGNQQNLANIPGHTASSTSSQQSTNLLDNSQNMNPQNPSMMNNQQNLMLGSLQNPMLGNMPQRADSSQIGNIQNQSNMLGGLQNMYGSSQNTTNMIGNQFNNQNLHGAPQNPQNVMGNLPNTQVFSNPQNPQNMMGSNPQNMAAGQQTSQHMMNNQQNPNYMLNPSQSPMNMLGATQTQQHSISSPQTFQNMLGVSQSSQNNLGNPQNPQNMFPNQQGSSNLLGNHHNREGNSGSSNYPQSGSNQEGAHNMTSNAQAHQSSANMLNQQSSQNMLGSMQGQHNMLGNVQNPSNMIGNQQNPQSMLQNQQNMLGNQQNSPNLFGGPNNPQNMMGNQQNCFSTQTNQQNLSGNQPLQPKLDNTSVQNPMGNQQNMMMGQQSSSATGHQQSMDGPNTILGNQQSDNQQNISGNQSSQNMAMNQQNMAMNQQNMFGNQQNPCNTSGNQHSMMLNQGMGGNHQGPQNMFGNSQNPMGNQDSGMGLNQNLMNNQPNSMLNQQSMMNQHGSGNQQNPLNDVMQNQQGGIMSDPMNSAQSNPLAFNSQQSNYSGSLNHPQNSFGMNSNQMGYFSNQNMMVQTGIGNQNMMPGQQNMFGGMQNNMGMMMMNQNSQGMGNSQSVMGNQMNNPCFPNNNMMNQPFNQQGVMNFPGMMNNTSGNFGMMNSQNNQQMNSMNPMQQMGNQNNVGMMRNPGFMGIRQPQNIGFQNPQQNQNNNMGMGGNFGASQNNFGMFGNNNPGNVQGNQVRGNCPSGLQGSSDPNNFIPPSDMSQAGNQGGNSFGNEFGHFNLGNEDSKMWDDLTSRNEEKGNNNSEKINPDSTVKSETSSPESKTSNNANQNSGSIDVKQVSETKLGTEVSQGAEAKDTVATDVDDKTSGKSPKPDNQLEEGEIKPDIVATSGGASIRSGREDPGIPYDWATELLKGYTPGDIEASAKMAVFFCILEESIYLGDRVLVFSQSLFTLNLIEDFLQKTNLPEKSEKWARNWNYFRLDGSTSAMEREKLINEFNSNPNIYLFLVSTRAGSLGINLVGANRVIVLDASWNPCHDTQAVCRVYRYGQKKPCFVYRLVTDNCLEKKIYDRQINKQGMADRVVDECNPDAHLSIKEVTNLCWDNEEDTETKDFSSIKDKYIDVIMQKVLERFSHFLSKEPFQHESLLVDRKDKKLSQAEKRLAKRSYELEKQASINNTRPVYGYYPGANATNQQVVGRGNNPLSKPMASVRPMQSELNNQLIRDATSGRPRQWIPADVWQKQGMSAQEMTLPLDVVIPTNSPDRSSIVLKAGQKVMVLKSPKGIYMQLENGKIIAIRTAFKVGGNKGKSTTADKTMEGKKVVVQSTRQRAPPHLLRNNSNISIIPRNSPVARGLTPIQKPMVRLLGPNKDKPWAANKQPIATAKPYFGESPTHPPVTVTVTKKRVTTPEETSTSGTQKETDTKNISSPQDFTMNRKEKSPASISQVNQESSMPQESQDSSSRDNSRDSFKLSDQHDEEKKEISKLDKINEDGGKNKVVNSVKMTEASKKFDKAKEFMDPEDSEDENFEEDEDDGEEDDDVSDPEKEENPRNNQQILDTSAVTKSSVSSKPATITSMATSSLKNYRHSAFQNKKLLSHSENLPKSLSISPISSGNNPVSALPVGSGNALSISPVAKPSVMPSPALGNSSLTIQPINLNTKKQVDTPASHTNPIPSLFNLTPPDTEKQSEPSAPAFPPALNQLKSMSDRSLSIFPVDKNQPSSTITSSEQMNTFNAPVNFNSYRPDFQQQMGSSRTDYYSGFNRGQLGGYGSGGFFPPRKDSNESDKK